MNARNRKSRYVSATNIIFASGLMIATISRFVYSDTWSGAISGSWSNVSNWYGGLPSSVPVLISSTNGQTNQTLDSNFTISSLEVSAGDAYIAITDTTSHYLHINGDSTNSLIKIDSTFGANTTGSATLNLGGPNTSGVMYLQFGGAGAGIVEVDNRNNGTNYLSIFASITGSTFTKQGNGVLKLQSGNSYTGTTMVACGTLAVASAYAIPQDCSITSGATVEVDGVSVISNYTLTINGNGISGGGALTGTGTAGWGGYVHLASDASIGSTGNLTISGVVSGANVLTIVGPGTVALSGTNGISGGIAVNSGILSLRSAGAIGISDVTVNGSGMLDLDGQTLGTGHSLTFGNNVALENSNAAAAATWSGNVIAMSNVTIDTVFSSNQNTFLALSGLVSGNGTITKKGNRQLRFLGNNTFNGTLIINEDTVLDLNDGGMTYMNVIMGGNATVGSTTIGIPSTYTTAPVIGSIASSLSNSTISFNTATLTVGNANSTEFDGMLNGYGTSSALIKVGTGTLTLTNANNVLTGGVQIKAGTLAVLADHDLGAAPASVTAGNLLLNGGTLLANANFTLASTRGIALGNTTGTGSGGIDAANGTVLTYNGIIANNGFGNGGLIKGTGGGTVVLGGSNTYSGGTTISNGTLLVDNTAGSATGSGDVVVNGGTLTGNGSVAGNVTLNGGSLTGNGTISGSVIAGTGPHTINPGDTPSVANLTLGGLSTNANTTLAFDLTSPYVPGTMAGSVNDQLIVTGNGSLSLNGGSIAIATNPTGNTSLGYYKAIGYTGNISGTGITSMTMPTVTNSIVYSLDLTHDVGFIDIHRGYLGDANDDGVVDSTDITIVLNNLGTTTSSWNMGNFDGAATIDLNDLNAVLNHLGTNVGTNAFHPGGDSLAYRLSELEDYVADFADPLTSEEVAEIQGYAGGLGFGGGSGEEGLRPAVAIAPEPASLGVLGLGVVGLLGRRRRPVAL